MPSPGEGTRIRVALAGLTVRELVAMLLDGGGGSTVPANSVAGDRHGQVIGDRARVPGERLCDVSCAPNTEGRVRKVLRGESDVAGMHELRARLRRFARTLTPYPAGVQRQLRHGLGGPRVDLYIQWTRVILDMSLRAWVKRHGHDICAWSEWERGLRALPEWTPTERLLLEQDMAAAVERLAKVFGECREVEDEEDR